ncbi:hypothetical protein P7F60_04895 [Rhizobium sp. YJ-22]|nr:hypothetical protein [Rhizobium sp. YJ-22]MDG3575712.1 hypothetical protein [Rhizobium sp. YJ-22]
MKLLALWTAILLFKLAKLLAAVGDIIAAPGMWILDHYEERRN